MAKTATKRRGPRKQSAQKRMKGLEAEADDLGAVGTPKLRLPVTCGNVSVGKESASIGIKVDRDMKFTGEEAETYFCNTRLVVRLFSRNGDDDPKQENLFLDSDRYAIRASGDANGYGTKAKYYSTRLKFSLERDFDESILAKLAQRNAWLEIEHRAAQESVAPREKPVKAVAGEESNGAE